MFNDAQIHLMTNHLPVVGCLFGFLILLTGFLIKNRSVKRTALFLMVLAMLTAIPAYLSGEPAEEVVEHKPGVTKELIHEHEEAAELAFVVSAVLGALSFAGLGFARAGRESLESKTTIAVLVLSGVVTGLLANTAHLGGMIRHDELRNAEAGAKPATQTNSYEHESEKEDD